MVVNGITFRDTGEPFAALGSPDGNHFPEPHDIVWMPDDSGLLAIVATSANTAQLWKYNYTRQVTYKSPNIQLDSGWTYQKKMKLDIDCDSDLVYYTDNMNTIFKYRLSTNTQLPYFRQIASPYVYAAFKLLPDNGIYIDASGSGQGPNQAVCLDADGVHAWTDKINETNDIHVFKRTLSDGTSILPVVTTLDQANPSVHTNKVTSLACYYNFCSNQIFVYVYSQVIT